MYCPRHDEEFPIGSYCPGCRREGRIHLSSVILLSAIAAPMLVNTAPGFALPTTAMASSTETTVKSCLEDEELIIVDGEPICQPTRPLEF